MLNHSMAVFSESCCPGNAMPRKSRPGTWCAWPNLHMSASSARPCDDKLANARIDDNCGPKLLVVRLPPRLCTRFVVTHSSNVKCRLCQMLRHSTPLENGSSEQKPSPLHYQFSIGA